MSGGGGVARCTRNYLFRKFRANPKGSVSTSNERRQKQKQFYERKGNYGVGVVDASIVGGG